MLSKVKEEEAKRRMKELLTSFDGRSLTGALCGYIFEKYAIEVLEKGGEFACRRLNKGEEHEEPDLRICASKKIQVKKPESGQTAHQLYVPESMNYPGIDAWIPGIGAFQMTVAKQHSINSSVEDDLAKLGRGAENLYWVLHTEQNYYAFTEQKPARKINQYAVLIKLLS